MLFFDIDSYNSFHCLPFTHDVNTKGKHIFLKYGCEFPHSRIYLISTTHFHWFLIVVSLSASYLTSHPWQPLPLPSWHIWEHYRQASGKCHSQMFWRSCWLQPGVHPLVVGRISYHYPPWMLMAESQPRLPVRSDGSLKRNRNRHQGRLSITQFLRLVYPRYPFQISSSWRSSCNATIHGNVPVMLV